MRAKLFFFITLLFFISMPYVFGLAVFAEGKNPQPFQFPGTSFLYDPETDDVGSDIAGYIKNLYTFGLWIAIILAVGMIVIGAIFITVNRGSVDKESEGKSYITQAVWGLLLLFGSWLILNTVNPELITLKTPGGPDVEARCPKDQVWDPVEGKCVMKEKVSAQCAKFSDIPLLPPRGVPPVDGKGSCYVKRFRNNAQINITSDRYYDESVTIPVNSIIWQYPYFLTEGTERGTSTAKCIIYAYRLVDSSTTEFVDLERNYGLTLCENQTQKTTGGYDFCNGCACPNCVPLSSENINHRRHPVGCNVEANSNPQVNECSVQPSLLAKLVRFSSEVRRRGWDDDEWMVSEAWPPTVQHSSQCHYNGTCVDIIVRPKCYFLGFGCMFKNFCHDVVQPFLDAAIAAGFVFDNSTQSINEYAQCTGSDATNPPGKKTRTGTGGHLHLVQ